MSAKPAKTRVQLSDADRKAICELAKSNRDLSHDKLTRLAAEKLGKDLKRPTVTQVLHDMKQQLKGFAAFMADNPQFSAEDEITLQRFSDKVAKMLVSRVSKAAHRTSQLFKTNSAMGLIHQ